MNQSLHIFRKDIRHLWPELATYAVLLVTYSWAVPQSWFGAEPNSLLPLLMVLIRTLLPVLWLVLIARLIQDESLVGDQQFWITRPYTRGSLLGAKFLFLVACVALPFLLMQCYLLLHAGLHPLASLPAMMLNVFMIALLCWLPFAAVASVTSTLPRMAMSLLGTAIVSIIVLVVIGRSIGLRMDPPFFLDILGVLFPVLLTGVLLYQYWTRKTKTSRLVLICTPFLLLGLFIVYPTGVFIPYRYSAPEGSTSHLSFDPDPLLQERQDGKEIDFGGRLMLNLPIHIEGLDTKARLNDAGVSVTLDAPGYHYQSPWIPGGMGIGPSSANLILPKDVVHRIQSTPTHLHLVFVSDELLPGSPEESVVANRFDMPDHGVCVLAEDGTGAAFCRYPYHLPGPISVSGTMTLPPCGPGAPSRPGAHEMNAFGPKVVFDPVGQEPLRMGAGVLCPGSKLTFTPHDVVNHIRAELDLPSVILGPYISHRHEDQQRGMPSTAPPAPPAGVAPPPVATPPQKAAPSK